MRALMARMNHWKTNKMVAIWSKPLGNQTDPHHLSHLKNKQLSIPAPTVFTLRAFIDQNIEPNFTYGLFVLFNIFIVNKNIFYLAILGYLMS